MMMEKEYNEYLPLFTDGSKVDEMKHTLSKPEALATIKFTSEADKKERSVEKILPAVKVNQKNLSIEISGETSKDMLFASSTNSEKYITPLKLRKLTKYKRLSEIDISKIVSPLAIPSYPPTPKPRKATIVVPPPNFDSSSESSEDEGGSLEDEQEPQQEIKETVPVTNSDGTLTSKGEELSSFINEVMDVADSIDSFSTEKVRCTVVDIDPTASEQISGIKPFHSAEEISRNIDEARRNYELLETQMITSKRKIKETKIIQEIKKAKQEATGVKVSVTNASKEKKCILSYLPELSPGTTSSSS
ncbi:hypothetical protein QYM36_014709 [Artemia franciscana]|uniref:Uncharacterized protein n=1 Tax=Artemia franciscana TaxID=6661 RepID=A0AA88HD77_ARTSF|nr:hypothetical protein QYM36_014709 [Artemia franciscana]